MGRGRRLRSHGILRSELRSILSSTGMNFVSAVTRVHTVQNKVSVKEFMVGWTCQFQQYMYYYYPVPATNF